MLEQIIHSFQHLHIHNDHGELTALVGLSATFGISIRLYWSRICAFFKKGC